MELLIHITIALGSIAFATYTVFSPSKTKLNLAYGLVAATFVTGFYLTWTHPAHLVQACATGLIYLGVVALALVSAHHRLVADKSE